MKHSKQRDIILKTVEDSYEHPTADTIYNIVKKNIPNISLGTVYRNLNFFVENGNIKKIIMPNNSLRFDKTITDHYHLSCSKCNNIYDIDYNDVQIINESVEKETGHKVISHDIVFLGICKHCK